jgi:hypothetical protein
VPKDHVCNPNYLQAEIRGGGMTVPSQPRDIDGDTLSQNNPSQKMAGGVAQSVTSEFKPQYLKKKRKIPNYQPPSCSHVLIK